MRVVILDITPDRLRCRGKYETRNPTKLDAPYIIRTRLFDHIRLIFVYHTVLPDVQIDELCGRKTFLILKSWGNDLNCAWSAVSSLGIVCHCNTESAKIYEKGTSQGVIVAVWT